MKRIMIIATVIAFGQAVGGFSSPVPQTPSRTTVRRIQVNAQTIAALPSDKKYVVDLTQRGVKYEFDQKAGQIDFDRVTVRTTRGEVAIGSFLEKNLPKDKLPALKNTSLALILVTRATGTVQTPLANPSKIIDCRTDPYCTCEGESACQELLDSTLCGGESICVNQPNQPVFCVCRRS